LQNNFHHCNAQLLKIKRKSLKMCKITRNIKTKIERKITRNLTKTPRQIMIAHA